MTLTKRQIITLIIILALLLFLPVAIFTAQRRQEIRPRALEATPSATLFPSACLTFPKTDTFDGTSIDTNLLWSTFNIGGSGNGDVTQSGGVLSASVDGTTQAIDAGIRTEKKVCGDFDARVDFSQFSYGQGNSSVATLFVADWDKNSWAYVEIYRSGQTQGISANVQLNGQVQEGGGIAYSGTSGKLRLKRQGTVFSMFYDTGNGWQLIKAFPNGFNSDSILYLRVGSWDPDRPAVFANFDNFYLVAVQPEPTFTPIPSRTPTPSISPTPTPPSGQDKYTIDVGDKQYLVFNIGPGQTPQIRFKARLANLANKPQMFLKLRVKDELAFINNPTAINSGDSCNNPPAGSFDFYVPATPEGEDYVPVPDINGPPPGGGKAAIVTPDGWISLDGVIAGKYYTLYLKGQKTRSTKVAEHVMLQPDKNTDVQDFNWTDKLLDSGDLPDPNNGLRQDCTVNSIDLSLITSRLGATDSDNLNIGDVNYDGIINGNDVSKVVNTLSTKPDDDL